MDMKTASAFLGAALALSFASAASAQFQDFRCERDSLDPAQAVGRLDWAVANAITDSYNVPWSPPLREMAMRQWDFHPVLKGRAMYPTYGVSAGPNTGIWMYPGDWRAPSTPMSSERPPHGYVQSMLCTSSCYRPEMRILLSGGYLDMRSANNLAKHGMNKVMVVDKASTLDDLQFKVLPVKSYTISAEEADHDLAVLTMEKGSILKVTTNHTFVNGEGKVLEVSRFKEGDSILRADGKPEKIASIRAERYRGKVYNVTPESSEPINQVVVAEGYLTGSAYYQNVELTDANRHLLRRNLNPDDLS